MKELNIDTIKRDSEEIERHPWVRFPKENNATKLILGSFPPQRFTQEYKSLIYNDIDFFYGSRDNNFWDLFCKSKNIDLNWQNLESLKDYLETNNWLISDIVLDTKRKKPTALDRDLDVQVWNIDLIKDILNSNEIEVIYFTSKWVQEHFCKYVAHHIEKIPKTIVLISPSRNGLISLNWAKEIFPTKNEETNIEYRERYYSHFINIQEFK